MRKKRIQWLDFARGIAILFVVFGHSVESIFYSTGLDSSYFKLLMSIAFTIAMPCFFAISGYLYKPVNNIHSYLLMLYKKLISLGFPYIIFSVIYVFMQNHAGESVHHFNSYSSLFSIYKSPISYMWFLYALFFMFIIVGLLDLIHINQYIQFGIYLIMMLISIKFPYLICSSTFNNIIYFYIGFLISNYQYYFKTFLYKKNMIYSMICLLVILFIFQSFFVWGKTTNSTTFSDFITKIVSIFLLIQVSSIIHHNNVFHYFDKYGKATLIIYLVHWPVISVLRVFLLKICPMSNIFIALLAFIIIFLSWYISIFVCYLAKKFTIINFIFYPRKQYISKLIMKTKWGRKLLEN